MILFFERVRPKTHHPNTLIGRHFARAILNMSMPLKESQFHYMYSEATAVISLLIIS